MFEYYFVLCAPLGRCLICNLIITCPKGRVYSNVAYEPTSSLLIATAPCQIRLVPWWCEHYLGAWWDMWHIRPLSESNNTFHSTEYRVPCMRNFDFRDLVDDGWRLTHSSYEFAQNEFVTCVDCIPLESTSTETGVKDFIVVGTTINRGEDLAVKGAVSPFLTIMYHGILRNHRSTSSKLRK